MSLSFAIPQPCIMNLIRYYCYTIGIPKIECLCNKNIAYNIRVHHKIYIGSAIIRLLLNWSLIVFFFLLFSWKGFFFRYSCIYDTKDLHNNEFLLQIFTLRSEHRWINDFVFTRTVLFRCTLNNFVTRFLVVFPFII